jgi:uncharacterized damage-inducible protein DinB
MITPAYVQTMARYNAEMNRRCYASAATLTDAQRKQDCGLFWGSLHATLNHLVWGDRTWLARFTGAPRPPHSMKDSPTLYDDFAELSQVRVGLDDEIGKWAGTIDQARLDGELVYYSGAAQRELRRPMALLVMHLFNHQTHHRGQAHAVLTRFGADTGDTDLPLVLRADGGDKS